MKKLIIFLIISSFIVSCTDDGQDDIATIDAHSLSKETNKAGGYCEESRIENIRVMSYNIKQGLPAFNPSLQACEGNANIIVNNIIAQNPHVVVIQESFDRDVKNNILKPRLEAAGYEVTRNVGDTKIPKIIELTGQYVSLFVVDPLEQGLDILGRLLVSVFTGGSSEDGGVFIASRIPIKSVIQRSFKDGIDNNACTGFDCQADKGFLVATLELGHKNYFHVIGTHLNAGNNVKDRLARNNQIDLIDETIGYLNLTHGSTIIAGDLNIDFHSTANDDFNSMVTTLDARPSFELAGQAPVNTLNARWEDICNELKPIEVLDYILVKQGYGFQQPNRATYRELPNAIQSDHIPIVSELSIDYPWIIEITNINIVESLGTHNAHFFRSGRPGEGRRYRWRLNFRTVGTGRDVLLRNVKNGDFVDLYDTQRRCRVFSHFINIQEDDDLIDVH